MVARIKKFSKGKKIYSTLWLVWVILLSVLIGLFIGFKNKMEETIPPKNGWTIEKNYKNIYTIINKNKTKNVKDIYWIYDSIEDDSLKLEEQDYPNYYVMDTKKTFDHAINDHGKKIDGTNIIKIKNELKNILKDKWNNSWIKLSVMDIIKKIRKFKIISNGKQILDYNLIDAANKILWSNSKYKSIDDVRKSRIINGKYNTDIAMGKKDGEKDIYLIPFYNHNTDSYDETNVLSLSDWNTRFSNSAIAYKNAVAAVGFVWLISMVLAIITTVSFSIIDKRRKEKKW